MWEFYAIYNPFYMTVASILMLSIEIRLCGIEQKPLSDLIKGFLIVFLLIFKPIKRIKNLKVYT